MACDFNKEDANEFIIDGESAERSNKIIFDGTMHPATEFLINTHEPYPLGNGYVSESDEIHFSDYKKVEAVE